MDGNLNFIQAYNWLTRDWRQWEQLIPFSIYYSMAMKSQRNLKSYPIRNWKRLKTKWKSKYYNTNSLLDWRTKNERKIVKNCKHKNRSRCERRNKPNKKRITFTNRPLMIVVNDSIFSNDWMMMNENNDEHFVLWRKQNAPNKVERKRKNNRYKMNTSKAA